MAFIYSDNEQVTVEIKKVMLDTHTTQREIAAAMDIKPQGLTKLFSKKNFGFEDASRILSAMGYEMEIDFKKALSPDSSEN